MKQHILTGLVALAAFALSACDDYTEIMPKGKNLLVTTEQLEMLLNKEYYLSGESDAILIGDCYPTASNIPNMVSQPALSLGQVLTLWLDDVNREPLVAQDGFYTNYYSVIGKIANPILMQIDDASGDEAMKRQLKAEALVLRAYFGYLLVNHFAKAYHQSTAANDGGIPYPREDNDIATPNEKYTVQQVYDMICEDLQNAIDLNSLPDVNVNQMRVSKAFAYAVMAKVMMSMGRYGDAEKYADLSLSINNHIADYNQMVEMGMYGNREFHRMYMECEEDLFFTHNDLSLRAFTPEYLARFEEGSVVRNCYPSDKNIFGFPYFGPTFYGMNIECWYLADNTFFNEAGLSTTDMYLIKAEVSLRNNQITDAMQLLDLIRVNRIMPESYAPCAGTITNKGEAIAKFKQVARTEKVMSVMNYIDIKRWNSENNEWTETEQKNILGKEYTLKPTSQLWIWTFPSNATSLNPNLTQNY